MTTVERCNRPAAIFLGAAERAAYVHDSGTSVPKWNLLGLKNVLLVNFLPANISAWSWVFAISPASLEQKLKLRIVHDDGTEVGSFTLGASGGSALDPLNETIGEERVLTLILPPTGYMVAAFRFAIPVIAGKSGSHHIILTTEGGEDEVIGTLEIAIVDPPPLTPDRIAAIKADPDAAKAARVEIGCKHCSTKLRAYTALERSDKLEREGYIWVEQSPDEFNCGCGRTRFDLASLKRNLFSILGHRKPMEDDASFEPLYQASTLEHARTELLKLLDRSPREEELQRFIQQNPILLHQFPSDRLFSKPPILTYFFADFCLVTPQKELVLIEIEKASTRLLKKNGDEAAELSHAINQITAWLHVVDEHRLAVLDSLGISRTSVSIVRGVVIAGRDRGNDAEHLRRLKGVDRGRISLLTYDDIAFGLLSLAKKMKAL